MSSLLVKFNGPNLIGQPISRTRYAYGVQVGTLEEYLGGLFGNWRTALIDGLRTFSHVPWNGKQTVVDSRERHALLGVVAPIIREGKIPKQIDQDTLIALSTPTMVEFEEALFELVKELKLLDEASQI